MFHIQLKLLPLLLLATTQGTRASYFNLPKATISMPNTAPVMGVPKAAPNPALIPLINRILVSVSPIFKTTIARLTSRYFQSFVEGIKVSIIEGVDLNA